MWARWGEWGGKSASFHGPMTFWEGLSPFVNNIDIFKTVKGDALALTFTFILWNIHSKHSRFKKCWLKYKMPNCNKKLDWQIVNTVYLTRWVNETNARRFAQVRWNPYQIFANKYITSHFLLSLVDRSGGFLRTKIAASRRICQIQLRNLQKTIADN